MAQRDFLYSDSIRDFQNNIIQIFPKDTTLDELDLDTLNKKEKAYLKDSIFRLFVSYCCADKELNLNKIIRQTEKALIMKSLFRFNGSIVEAAEALGVKYTTLYEKVRRHNIQFEKRPI
jgi:transcriptional regulator of acetoin/glycerol metabolism